MLSHFYTTAAAAAAAMTCFLWAPNLGDPWNHCFGPMARQYLMAEIYGRAKEWQPLTRCRHSADDVIALVSSQSTTTVSKSLARAFGGH